MMRYAKKKERIKEMKNGSTSQVFRSTSQVIDKGTEVKTADRVARIKLWVWVVKREKKKKKKKNKRKEKKN